MESDSRVCDLDDTWEDITGEFKESLQQCSTWKCFSVEGVDKEGILSAPEIMDPKTDTGLGFKDIYSLKHLFETNAIPEPASFADDDALVAIMDYLHVRELHYLHGYSLVQSYLCFPYFLNLEKLKDGNPVLYAYCRALLRTLESVLRTAFSTNIRGDEEFMAAPPELDIYMNLNIDDVVNDLEELAAKASPAVAIRLRWRKNFVQALSLFQSAAARTDVERACSLCQEAKEWLESHAYQRTSEPSVNPALIRDKEVPFWVSIITPTEPLAQPPFVEAMGVYKTLLSQMASLATLLNLPSLNAVTEFIEDLGAANPLLLMRCVAVMTLFSKDPNESFLFGLPLHQRLLEMLAKTYGAPLYLKVFEENRSVIDSIVKFRVQKTMRDPTKVTQQQYAVMHQQTIEAVHHWTNEACKHYLIHLEIMLCNRGLAHRRLMNAVPGLADFQEISYMTDMNIFLFRISGGNAQMEQEASRISKVLTLWANTLVLHAIELIVRFQIELDLLKPGELIPAMVYLSSMHKAQTENMLFLALQNTSLIPENRTNKKRVPLYNLSLTTRTHGELDYAERSMMEIQRLLADCQLFAACVAEKKGLADLTSTGSASLTSAENLFNHRYHKCFRSIQSPSFATYQQCMASKPPIKDEEVLDDAKRASQLAVSAAEKVRAALQHPSASLWQGRRERLEMAERTARSLAASLSLMSDASTVPETFQCASRSTPGLPYLLTFTVQKK